MNGRIYDALLGRFLSADLIVQNPSNLQCFNRYSYVLNNPVRYTDPTGFETQDEQWQRLLGEQRGRWKAQDRQSAQAVAAARGHGSSVLDLGRPEPMGLEAKLGSVGTDAEANAASDAATTQSDAADPSPKPKAAGATPKKGDQIAPTPPAAKDPNSETVVTEQASGHTPPMSPTRLRPGTEPALDAMMANQEMVDAIGTLYGLNKKYGTTRAGYREYFLTLYRDAPVVGFMASGERVPLGSPEAQSFQEIARARLAAFFSINHSQPQTGGPTWPVDFASQTVVGRLGGWSIIVDSKKVYFTGPNQSQYYYLPTRDFIRAGQAAGRTIPIPAEPAEHSTPGLP